MFMCPLVPIGRIKKKNKNCQYNIFLFPDIKSKTVVAIY